MISNAKPVMATAFSKICVNEQDVVTILCQGDAEIQGGDGFSFASRWTGQEDNLWRLFGLGE
jgi:predicted secreted protein